MQRTCHKTIVIHPHTGQFIINELPTLVLCGTVWVYGLSLIHICKNDDNLQRMPWLSLPLIAASVASCIGMEYCGVH